MKKLTMILAALITAILLQGCGTSGAMPGSVSGSTTDVASSGTDQAPTITYMGFAVVQQDGG
ncbi:MAG TPA: hypothetical protein VLV87_10350, partial [Gammaproteobacteria bacterium]|nr:hypothetical protein [Gammaproteobacteria bacterium]